MPQQLDLKRFVDGYLDAFNRHDVDRLVDYYTDDCVREESLVGKLTGKDAVRGFYQALFQGFPDCHRQLQTVLGTPELVALEWTFSGTDKGRMPAFPSVPPTGKCVAIHDADFLELRDGKIAIERMHTDYGSALEQLGLKVSPAAAQAEKTPEQAKRESGIQGAQAGRKAA